MKVINLRKYYPELYSSDCEIVVPEEVAALLKEFDRRESAHRIKVYRNKAYYSLDADDQIETEAIIMELSPPEILERKQNTLDIYAAMTRLPAVQAKRVYAHYILGESIQKIAWAEGVSEQAVRLSVKRGVRNMKKYLIKML